MKQASQLDSTHFQNSKARAWVLRHSRVPSRVISSDGVPTLPDAAPSERSKVTTSARDEKLQAILQSNPQDFLSKLLQTDGLTLEISKDVLDFTWTKSIANPAGTFSMTLKTDVQNYTHVLDSDDMVVVELDNGFGEVDVVSILLIDRVRRHRRAEANFSTTERAVVTGRDLGKVLVETAVFIDSAPGFFQTSLLKLFSQFGLTVPGGKFGFGVQPHLIVPTLIKAFASLQLAATLPPSESSKLSSLKSVLGQNKPLQQFVFPGDQGTNIVDTFDLTDAAHGGYIEPTIGALAFFQPPKDAAITLWELIDQFTNRLVNEMFFDLRPVKTTEKPSDTQSKSTGSYGSQNKNYRFSMIMRQQPFDIDARDKLTIHDVQDHEVLELDVGKSSHNVMNAFRVYLFNHGIASLADQGWPSIYNLESVAHHGLKRYQPESTYPWPDIQSAQNQDNAKGSAAYSSAFSVANQYLERIITWNASNEEFQEGTITMRLRPSIRAGECIRLTTYDGDVTEFYIESLSHSFRYPGTSTTTVTVTRGTPIKIRGEVVNFAVSRLKLGAFKSIGPTFLGYTIFGNKQTFILGDDGLPSAPASTTQIAPADDTAAAPVGDTPKQRATKSDIKALCTKWGEGGAGTLPWISPALLYGICSRETSLGQGKLIAYDWPGYPTPIYNPPTNDHAVGIMQVKTGSAISAGFASATSDQLLNDNDFNMQVAVSILKSYRGVLNAAIGSPATQSLLVAAYHSGIGTAVGYVNNTLTAPQLAAFSAILTASYATPILAQATRSGLVGATA